VSKLKVRIENNSGAYAQMFVSNGWDVVDHVVEADLLQLEGGADVSPSLYGEESHPTTYSSKNADDRTTDLYNSARAINIPIAGICRGSQFLCVMGGGKLWQDVDGHAKALGHSLLDAETGAVIAGCSSMHHQQHRPASNAIIIATAFPQLSTIKYHMDEGANIGTDIEDIDVEAFYYPHINALGYQPHPEFFGPDHPCQKYYFDIIRKYLRLRA